MKKKVVFLAVFLIIAAVTSGLGVKYYDEPERGVASIPKTELSYEDKIREVVKKNIPQIEECYNQRLQQGLDKNGKLKISWLIDENGAPSLITEIDNGLRDSDLYDCSSDKISSWKFPKGSTYQINYTFNLKQKENSKLK